MNNFLQKYFICHQISDTLILQAIENILLKNGNVIPFGYVNATQMFLDNEYILSLSDLLLIEYTLEYLTGEKDLKILSEDGVLYIHPLIAYLGGISLGLKNKDLKVLFLNNDELYKDFLNVLWEACYINRLKFVKKTGLFFYLMSLESRKITSETNIIDVFKPCNFNTDKTFLEKIGFVYLFTNKEKTKIKVGFTTNVDARIKQLELASGEYLEIVKIWDERKLSTEIAFHKKYLNHPCSLNGEWFVYTKEMLQTIERYFDFDT